MQKRPRRENLHVLKEEVGRETMEEKRLSNVEFDSLLYLESPKAINIKAQGVESEANETLG